MLKDNTLTYISLFSSAGVGCYGFKKAGYECIATNELIERRLDVQKMNEKCIYQTGYISGDITLEETKSKISAEINRWKRDGNDKVDVVIATPPCQGMSVANHKKADNEIVRNSLVVESIKIINEIKPRFFVLENVSAFWKTGCVSPSNEIKAIGDVVNEELGKQYVIMNRIINFKNYGSNSSRTRTVVIGVENDSAEYVAPIELYPQYEEEKTLIEIIGDMPKLEWNEFAKEDFYHQFRIYPENMRDWIHGLQEGQSAFDNEDVHKQPHKIINGKVILNKKKNGDKYTRQYWNKVSPCIHTRNDQLASQCTIHPGEDRVFSIRELMRMMTIPDSFRWVNHSLEELNALPEKEKYSILKKEEIKIRQSIGEAVPTEIFYRIACNISDFMSKTNLNTVGTNIAIEEYKLGKKNNLKEFIKNNPMNLGYASLARIAELTNAQRENNSAFFTNKFIINEISKELPDIYKEEINIMEPSVGIGNFLPFIFIKYEEVKKVNIDVVDIDKNALDILQLLLEKIEIPKNVTIRYIRRDSLLYYDKHYDLTIGNPPFTKMKPVEAEKYIKNNYNKNTANLFEFFLEKAVRTSDYVAMITPKALLNTPEFQMTRDYLENFKVFCIEDFGEKGFRGVLVETICIFINTFGNPGKTKISSFPLNLTLVQRQKYIFDKKYPYWIIYRNSQFDATADKLTFNIFDVFRDRQITNSNSSLKADSNTIRVLKSRNISDDGTEIIDIDGYDAYIDSEAVQKMAVYRFFNSTKVYLTPNMTYKPRVTKMKANMVVNGSVAILLPKVPVELTVSQMKYFSTEEFRNFYKIARNYQTRSLNVDGSSCFWFGIQKN